MNFCSDNVTGASAEVLDALVQASEGVAMPYGEDNTTKRLRQRFNEIFETEVRIFPVATGTAANALSLAAMTPFYGAVFCHEESHVWEDECGAPEFFNGTRLVPLKGPHCKLSPAILEDAMGRFQIGFVHRVQPAAVTFTQATEAGTVYSPDEILAISEFCKNRGLKLHADGARFANALETIGCSPADATWRAGLDVLSFGATKNGVLAAEAIVFFDESLATDFEYRRKRAGHLFSKMRFLSAQLEAYLTNDLWLKNAGHANKMATRLATELSILPDTELLHPVQANQVFITMPERVIEGLFAAGFQFYRWHAGGEGCIRLMTAFNTSEEVVTALLDTAQKLSATSCWE